VHLVRLHIPGTQVRDEGRATMKHIYGLIAAGLFLASIVAANLMTDRIGLVTLPLLGWMVTAGTFAVAWTFVLRDAVHEAYGRWWSLALIALGCLITWMVTTPGLAAASALAFAASEVVDLGVYQQIRQRSIYAAVVLSSSIAAPVDTILFLQLAGFPLTWQAVAGQVLVKTAMAVVGVTLLALSQRVQEHQTQPAV